VAAGTRGRRSAIAEHELALSYALALEARLLERGWMVVLTRREGGVAMSNRERAELANRAGVSACLHVHLDGVRTRLRWLGALRSGSTTIVASPSHAHPDGVVGASVRLASTLHPALVRGTGLRDRGIAMRNDLTSLNWNRVPTALLELGYLTHPRDEARLVDPICQEDVARSLAEALDTWREGTRR
jgi:N-acetylmuramoyl-L-alanine amidase